MTGIDGMIYVTLKGNLRMNRGMTINGIRRSLWGRVGWVLTDQTLQESLDRMLESGEVRLEDGKYYAVT